MRLRYVEQFRALAIVMIVAGHAWYMQDWDRGSLAARLSLTIATNGTYLFVFIAGFLFQHLLPKFETWRYYRSKLRNVVLPYLIVSIPGLIWQFSKEPSGLRPRVSRTGRCRFRCSGISRPACMWGRSGSFR